VKEPAIVFGLIGGGFLLIIALAALIEAWRARWDRTRASRLVDPCPPPFYPDERAGDGR
jgi:hypothetical protein